jgi:hypothetical protein
MVITLFLTRQLLVRLQDVLLLQVVVLVVLEILLVGRLAVQVVVVTGVQVSVSLATVFWAKETQVA